MSNVVDFKAEADKRRDVEGKAGRRAPDNIENSGYYRYVLELEHEIMDLKEQICVLHRDLVRARAKRK